VGKRVHVPQSFIDFCRAHTGQYRYQDFAEIAVNQFGVEHAGVSLIDRLFRKHGIKSRKECASLPDKSIITKSFGTPKGRKVKFKYIKIGGEWLPLNRYTWEQNHGKLRPDECLIYLDGDTLNCNLDNLYKLTKSDFARLRLMKIKGNDPELRRSACLLAQLKGAVINKAHKGL
jgi:hypothetical protein